MAADYAFLAGLTGRKNWDAIDAQKNRELQYQYMINNLKEQDLEKQKKEVSDLQNIYQIANNIEILEPDRDRVKAVSDGLKENIKNGVKEYGGDFGKYMEVQGMVDAKNYLNTLLNHPTTIKAMHNAKISAQYSADKAAGLMTRTDANGYGTEEGMRDYYAGKTDTIPYYGAFKPGEFDVEQHVRENYANAERTPKDLTPQEYLDLKVEGLVGKGMHKSDAYQQALPEATQYKQRIESGQPKFQWKSDKQPTALDQKIKEERYELMRNRNLKNIQQASDSWEAVTSGQNAMGVTTDKDGNKVPPVMNVEPEAYQSIFGAPPEQGADGKPIAGYLPTPLGEADKKAMATTILGLTYDKKKGGYVGNGLVNGDKILSAQNLMPLTGNLNNHKFVIKDVDHTVVVLPSKDSKKPPQKYVLVHADIPESDADDLGIWEHHSWYTGVGAFIPDRANKAMEGSGRKGVTTEGSLGRVFPLLIPLENIPLNLRESYTKKVKLGTLSNDDIADYMNEQAQPEDVTE